MCRYAVRIIPKCCPDIAGISVRMCPKYASEYAVSLSEMEDCFADNNTPEQEVDLKWLEDAVNSFISSLPDDARKVFIGRYYFFDSVKTIAKYCGISEANTKTLLYRTRQKLKDYLVKEGIPLVTIYYNAYKKRDFSAYHLPIA